MSPTPPHRDGAYDSPVVRVQLELETGSDPISGRLLDGSNGRHPFAGWLELMAAVDAALARRVDGPG